MSQPDDIPGVATGSTAADRIRELEHLVAELGMEVARQNEEIEAVEARAEMLLSAIQRDMHDAQTWLSAVRGYLQLLQDEDSLSSEEAREDIREAARAADMASRVFGWHFALLRPRAVRSGEGVKDLVSALSDSVATLDSAPSLSNTVDPDTPVSVALGAAELRGVIEDVMSRARLAAAESPLTVDVRTVPRRRLSHGPRHVRIRVAAERLESMRVPSDPFWAVGADRSPVLRDAGCYVVSGADESANIADLWLTIID